MAGAKTYNDVLKTPGLEGPAMNFYFGYTPQVGLLCLLFSSAALYLRENVALAGS